jgi:hypothetical protein
MYTFTLTTSGISKVDNVEGAHAEPQTCDV